MTYKTTMLKACKNEWNSNKWIKHERSWHLEKVTKKFLKVIEVQNSVGSLNSRQGVSEEKLGTWDNFSKM